ncbi:MAG: hypothetical protein QM597_01810 [Aeromicrobium sp.]|uniref:hypothetical protein n=1 Tax=Aeromicrobium sp. TaxID=1871063 RepID=UPI0039E56494
MRLDRYRRTTLAAVAVAAALTAGACGTSFDAQTNQQYQAGIGADERGTDVQVLGALLVANEDGSATLSGTLVNTTDTDQRLTTVTLADADGTQFVLASDDEEELLVAPGQARTLGMAEADSDQQASKVYTTTGIDHPGLYYTLTLTFADAGEVTISIPSVARNSIYAGVALPPGADPAENDKRPGDGATEDDGAEAEHGTDEH